MIPSGGSHRVPETRRRTASLGLLLLSAFAFLASPVRAQVDAGETPPSHAPFVLPFKATDVVFDSQRGMLYVTSLADKRVYFVDLTSGLITHQFSFTRMPESLALTPDGSRLFVALLNQPHSSYWWDPHSGYIASFALDLQVKDREFPIGEDPFDLVATSNGKLVVVCWHNHKLREWDPATGARLEKCTPRPWRSSPPPERASAGTYS